LVPSGEGLEFGEDGIAGGLELGEGGEGLGALVEAGGGFDIPSEGEGAFGAELGE
jgi:hypothetical protein